MSYWVYSLLFGSSFEVQNHVFVLPYASTSSLPSQNFASSSTYHFHVLRITTHVICIWKKIEALITNQAALKIPQSKDAVARSIPHCASQVNPGYHGSQIFILKYNHLPTLQCIIYIDNYIAVVLQPFSSATNCDCRAKQRKTFSSTSFKLVCELGWEISIGFIHNLKSSLRQDKNKQKTHQTSQDLLHIWAALKPLIDFYFIFAGGLLAFFTENILAMSSHVGSSNQGTNHCRPLGVLAMNCGVVRSFAPGVAPICTKLQCYNAANMSSKSLVMKSRPLRVDGQTDHIGKFLLHEEIHRLENEDFGKSLHA